ncbi:MAG TPA: GTPase HflX [Actinomycetota bacterium]|nr:GTPase HflX [Actinomycetota bacterium]
MIVGLARSAGGVAEAEASLEELALLADTAGADTIERVVQVRESPEPATYLGRGKAKQVIDLAYTLDAGMVIFDDELAPAQGRNLEDLAGVNPLAPFQLKIIDRTGLILDVFSQHAHSSEGKLQVELAQLNYQIPRLRGWGDVMSRIGGGIGTRGPTRGPGETKLEVDRRRIRKRLAKVKTELEDVERTREIKRSRRVRTGVPQVSLVGYTNSGKSTLLNALTGAGALVEDRLFSTVDPTARRLELPDGRAVVLIDTVGFVKKLPHMLVEAFRSTLEETAGSDLLLHVVDAAQTDPVAQIEAVQRVLTEIGAGEVPAILAFNKRDLAEPSVAGALSARFPGAMFISARTGEGLPELLEAVAEHVAATRLVVGLLVPFDRGDIRSQIHEQAEVLEETFAADGYRLKVKSSQPVLARFAEFVADPGGRAAGAAGTVEA